MISPITIATVRDRTDIHALIGETVRLVRRGRSFLGLCPFHKEKSPSFSVNAERGVFYCFGCKEHGSAIDYVMKLEGLTFPAAVRSLAERAGIEVEDGATDNERREADAARRAKEDLYSVNALAATFYEHSLRGGPGMRQHALAPIALDELARRGASEAHAALQAFRIGYAPHAWDGLTTFLAKHGVSPAIAERVGLLVPRTSGEGYYDRFRHRLMFPVLDAQGRVVAFSGRALPEPEGAPVPTEKSAKYINSPESPIYTKGEHLFGLYQARQAIRQGGEAVLVEGNFDVFSLHARGVENVVAPLGTAFTEVQARLLKRYAQSVTVFFDGDLAGEKATWAARFPCRAAGLTARAATLPAGMDPDDVAQRRGAEGVRALVSGSPPLAHRLMDLLLREGSFDGKPVHDPVARAHAAIRFIAESGDEIERGALRGYAEQIQASIGGQPIAELTGALARPREPAKAPVQRGDVATEMSNAILGILLDVPALLDAKEAQDPIACIEGDAALALLALRRDPSATPERLVESMPESLRAFVARRLARPVYAASEDGQRFLRAYARTIRASRPRSTEDIAS